MNGTDQATAACDVHLCTDAMKFLQTSHRVNGTEQAAAAFEDCILTWNSGELELRKRRVALLAERPAYVKGRAVEP